MLNIVCLGGNSDNGSFAKIIRELDGKTIGGRRVAIRELQYFGVKFTPDTLREYILQNTDGLEEYVLLGSSFGGHVSNDIAGLVGDVHCNRVRGLRGVILVGTPPAGTMENIMKAFIPPKEDLAPGQVPLLSLLSLNRPMKWEEANRFMSGYGWTDVDPRTLSQEDAAHYTRMMADLIAEPVDPITYSLPATRYGILSRVHEYGDERSITERTSRRIPYCVIHGELDPVISLEYLRGMDWKIFEDRIHVIKGASHYAQWSHPEEFAAIVERFIETL